MKPENSSRMISKTRVNQEFNIVTKGNTGRDISVDIATRYGWTVRQWRTQEFCSGGKAQQIQLRAEDRENRDLEAVAP